MSAASPAETLEALKVRWTAATTHRERARLEDEMWGCAPYEARKAGRVKWLARLLHTTHNGIEDRCALYLTLPDSEAVWQRVESPERMLIATGHRIVASARSRAKRDGLTFGAAVRAELAAYDALPCVRHTADGNAYRYAPHRGAAPTAPAPASPPPTPPTGARPAAGTPPTATTEWRALRAALTAITDRLLGDADEHARELLRGNIEAEIGAMIKVIQNRIAAAKHTARLDAVPLVDLISHGRHSLSAACQLLGVDPPRGARISPAVFALAKRHFKRLVREYHPDHGGHAERYDAVVKAMTLLTELYSPTGDPHHG